MTIRHTSGSIISEIRLAKNMSQHDFSENVCSQSYLSRVEAEETKITFDKLVLLLSKRQISLAEFEILMNHKLVTQHENELLIHTLDPSFYSSKKMKLDYLSSYMEWLKNIFGIQYKYRIKKDTVVKVENILNQDVFFYNDLPFLIYNLETLPFDTALYNYKRIIGQSSMIENPYLHRPLALNATLTIAMMSLRNNKYEDGLLLLTKGLTDALQSYDVNHIILFNLLLFKETNQTLYLSQANKIKEIFSKDNFYDYWYNILINKK